MQAKRKDCVAMSSPSDTTSSLCFACENSVMAGGSKLKGRGYSQKTTPREGALMNLFIISEHAQKVL